MRPRESKDRISITYTAEHSGESREVELPFKMHMLGNYYGHQLEQSISERSKVNIHRGNFHDVMQALPIHLKTTVPNRLQDGAKDLSLDLKINSLDDFHPDQLIEQIPELHTLLQLRQHLVELKTHPHQAQKTIASMANLLINPPTAIKQGEQ